jgi:purine-binding chemotaxis protein CheW
MDNATVTGNQYLTFTLAGEQYAVEVIRVREVLPDRQLTVVPRMPVYMKGIINIRGNVVPVVDLRLKFDMEPAEKTADTSIIVMNIPAGPDGDRITVGCLADSVQEVVEISPETVQPPPSLGMSLDTQLVGGIAKREDRFVILLDIDEVFRSVDLEVADAGAPTSGEPQEHM